MQIKTQIIAHLLFVLLAGCSNGDNFISVIPHPTETPTPDLREGENVSSADLQLDSTDYDFGVQSVMGYTNKIFTVKNLGSLSATNVTVTGSTSAFLFNYKITANQCGTVIGNDPCTFAVTFHPTKVEESLTTITVSYVANGQSKSLSLRLRGIGSNVASLKIANGMDTTSTSFGSLAQGASVEREFDVIYAGAVPATGVVFTVPPPFSLVTSKSTCGVTVSAKCKITVRYDASSLGAQAVVMKVTYNNSAFAAQDTHTISGSSVAVSTPAVLKVNNGNAITLGKRLAGKPYTATVAVQYSGTIPATGVTLASFASSNYSLVSSTCGAQVSTNCALTIQFTPLAAGMTYTDTVRLNYNSGSANTSASASISGVGANPALLTISPTNDPYDFGSSPVGKAITRTFTLSNPSTSVDATLVAITTAAPFSYNLSASSACGSTLASGATCNFNMIFTPANTNVATGKVTASYNDGNAAASVQRNLKGQGLSDGTLAAGSSTTIDFGTLVVGDTKTLAISISYFGTETVILDSITNLAAPYSIPGGPFPGVNSPMTGACGASTITTSCVFWAKFSPTAVGTFTTPFVINYHTGSGAAGSKNITFSFTGKAVQPPAALSIAEGASYNFGNVVVSSSADKVFNVVKSGSAPVTGVSGSAMSSGFVFKGGTFPGTGGTCGTTINANCTIVLSFAPTVAGAASLNFKLNYNDGLGARSVSLALSGTGVAGANLVLSASMPGKVSVGSSANFVVTVKNQGGLTASNISGLSGVSAPFSLVSTTCSASLAAGGSCTHTIRFAPTDPGVANDTLAISYLNGVTTTASSAQLVVSGTGTVSVAQFSANGDHTCALDDTAQVKCWGHNNYGQLGLGDKLDRGDSTSASRVVNASLPDVDLGTGKWAKAVSAGFWHTCAILNDDSVKCWGANNTGQLGQGASSGSKAIVGDEAGEMGNALAAVSLGSGVKAKSISAGYAHTCVITMTDQLKCWGHNGQGQLGYGDTRDRGGLASDMGDDLPFVDLGAGKTVKQVVADTGHTCAVLNDNSLRCWGDNFYGQLGASDSEGRGDEPGEMGDALRPIDMGPGRTVTSVSAGGGFTCAILDTGAVKCWGHNYNGNLGRSWCQNQTEQVGSCSDPLYQFPLNGYGTKSGQMGLLLPAVDLGTGRKALSIAASNFSVCALLDNSTIKCWGDNQYGQLGLGDAQARGESASSMGNALPAVSLTTTSGVTPVSLSSGNFHSCAMLSNQQLKCWGSNRFGELGLGDTINRGDMPNQMGANLPPIVWY